MHTNAPLDKVEPLPDEADGGDGDTDPDEAAWRTAARRRPGWSAKSELHEEVAPDELYDKLRPFKDKVAEDIKDADQRAPDAPATLAIGLFRASTMVLNAPSG